MAQRPVYSGLRGGAARPTNAVLQNSLTRAGNGAGGTGQRLLYRYDKSAQSCPRLSGKL